MSNNFTEEENNSLYTLGNVQATAAARLYTSTDDRTWQYDGTWGGLVLVEEGTSHYLRIADLSSLQVLWQQEIYQGMEYSHPKPFFHTFEGNDAVIGLSFADENDAATFYDTVLSVIPTSTASAASTPRGPSIPSKPIPHHPAPAPAPHGGPPPINRGPPVVVLSQPSGGYDEPEHNIAPPSIPRTASRPPPPSLAHQNSATNLNIPSPAPSPSPAAPVSAKTPVAASSAGNDKKKKKGSGFGFGFGKMIHSVKGKIGLGEEEPEVEIDISVPRDFRHESHIGWDPANGFEIRNIPPQWRKLFQAAGVKKSELRDADTAKFIMDTVAQATVGVNPMASGGGGPPEPSMGGPPPPTGGPPPPATSGPPPPPGAGPPVPSAGGGGGAGGLLAGLGTVNLKKAEDRVVPDIDHMPEGEKGNLADTLAKAMEARRDAINQDSDDYDSADEWSS